MAGELLCSRGRGSCLLILEHMCVSLFTLMPQFREKSEIFLRLGKGYGNSKFQLKVRKK